jgi:putative ATP-binding cassette transporter
LKLTIARRSGKIGIVLYVTVLALELSQILVSLRMIEWSKTFYDALQQLDGTTAMTQVGVFGLIVLAAVALTLSSTFVRKHLEIRWRSTLTSAVMDRWFANKAFMRLESDRAQPRPDNPDQRIAEDCRLFLAGPNGEHGGGSGLIPLSIDLVTNVVAILSYLAVLWSLSEFALSLNFIGISGEIPRYMVWAAFLYVILCSALTHWLGNPLKALYMAQQRREADFRFGLVRVRENADAIALSNGETVERRDLDTRFGGIVDNWKRLIVAELRLISFTYPYMYTVLRIPTFLALPAFFAGSVTFGGLMQLASAFSQVVTTLSWFIFSYRPLADLVAAASRLTVFLDAMEAGAPSSPALSRQPATGPDLSLSGLAVATPAGRELLTIGGLNVRRGEAVWLKGASGLGKTSLLKTIAGTWPHAKGAIELPEGEPLFLPQRTYFPDGTLLDAAVYPRGAASFDQSAITAALRAVGLGHRLDTGGAPSTLSGGEQQRLALARLLLLKPEWAFLDEATSSLDLGAEADLLALLRRELPQTAFFIVSHREPKGIGAFRAVEADSSEATPPVAEPVPA